MMNKRLKARKISNVNEYEPQFQQHRQKVGLSHINLKFFEILSFILNELFLT